MANGDRRLSVLLVEDSIYDALLIEELMKDVAEARRPVLKQVNTLAKALDELGRTDFDCVLLDLGLPDGGGIVNVDVIRAACPRTAVVVLTGLDDESSATAALRQGAQEYLIKGRYDDDALLRMIRHAVERHRLLAELDRRLVKEGFLASHDVLTRLPNRQQFDDRVVTELERAAKNGQSAAICFLDLDGFKGVNDTWGHALGDAVLREVSRLLSETVREGDIVARIGGDEFAILLLRAGPDEAAGVVERVRSKVAALTEVEGRAITIGVSIGVAIFPEHGSGMASLLAHADQAMYKAKRRSCSARGAVAPGS